MIGVAFAIHETFGEARDIERVALADVAARLARTHGLEEEAAIVLELANEPAVTFTVPARLRNAFSATLDSNLSQRLTVEAFEGLVRGAAARATVDRFVADDGVTAVLRALAELNVPRAALSLRWPGVDRLKAESAGFDGTIVFADALAPATDCGPLAPFARLAAVLRLPSDCIYLIGTNPRAELHLAALAGMRTVWLARDDASYPSDLPPPDHTIARLDELLPLLSGPYTRGLLGLRDVMRTTLQWRDGYFVPSDADILPDRADRDDVR